MWHSLVLLLVYFLITLSCDNLENTTIQQEYEFIKEEITELEDTIVSVEINKNIIVKWNNKTHTLIHDDSFKIISKKYEQYENILIDSIVSTKTTNAIFCNGLKLKKGDISFFIIGNIRTVPLIDIFETQLDNFTNCDYPSGIVEVLHQDRMKIKNELELYFSKHKLTLEERKAREDWNNFLTDKRNSIHKEIQIKNAP